MKVYAILRLNTLNTNEKFHVTDLTLCPLMRDKFQEQLKFNKTDFVLSLNLTDATECGNDQYKEAQAIINGLYGRIETITTKVKKIEKNVLSFEWSWEFIDVGMPRKFLICSHDAEISETLPVISLHEYLQDNGLAESRKLVKKYAKNNGLTFKETKVSKSEAAEYTIEVAKEARREKYGY